MSANNRISTIVERQLPDFIRADHPNFVALFKKYYEFLEQEGMSGSLRVNKSLPDYADVDSTRSDLIQYLKTKIIPDFPDETALSKEKVIKLAKSFYQKKGTPDSFKFLFKVVYGVDIEVYFPKDDILKVSDGKWKLPQALRLSIIGTENENFDISLLVKRKGVGEISRTTCVIEQAYRTIDVTTGKEVVEVYISNINRLFDNGENLVVDYGGAAPFSSKIISLISNIKLYRNRFGVYQQGLNYVTGDPVAIIGGLAAANDAIKAVATVGNVSSGSIASVDILSRGYYFRPTPNSLIRVTAAAGIGSDIVINAIYEDAGNADYFLFNTDSIAYMLTQKIYDASNNYYSFDNVAFPTIIGTTGAGNTTNSINLYSTGYAASAVTDYYAGYLVQIVGGLGVDGAQNSATIISYNGTTKIATLNTSIQTGNSLSIAAGANSNVSIRANAQTSIAKVSSYANVLLGTIRSVDVIEGGSFFKAPITLGAISVHETNYTTNQGSISIGQNFSDYITTTTPPTVRLTTGSASSIDDFYLGCRLFLDVGATEHYVNVIGYVGATKTLLLDRTFESNINQTNIRNMTMRLDFRDNVRSTGRLGKLVVYSGGTGYSGTDYLEFVGTGYGAKANLVVSSGVIVSATLNTASRGEGYYENPTIVVRDSTGNLSAGANASIRAFRLSDGENLSPNPDDVGKIQDFVLSNRGFDYESTPLVSIKIIDVLTNNLSPTVALAESSAAWQGGTTNATATFNGRVDSVYRANTTHSVIRLYNYSGTINVQQPIQLQSTTGNISATVLSEDAVISFNGINPAVTRTYPVIYGNGLAKANAEFLNGLIKYNGYYLNTDGFISADKRLQNKDYYHNFSYEIQSEKTLADFGATVYRVAHPAGMQLLAKTILKTDEDLTATINMASTITSLNSATTNVTASAFDTNARAIIAGTLTPSVNVGDLIRIGSATTDRYLTKVVKAIANTQSAPTLTLDFIGGEFNLLPNGTSILTLDSNTSFMGDGRIATTNNSNVLTVTGNTSALTPTIAVGDSIRFNIADYRTNLLTYSEGFDQASWVKVSGSILANTVTAPDGTFSADLFYPSVTGTATRLYQNAPILLPQVFSVYAKAAGVNFLNFRRPNNSVAADVYFDLVNGIVTSGTGTIVSAGNGWYLCSAAVSTTGAAVSFAASDASGSTTVTASGTSGIYIWGAQLREAGSSSGYIPTTTVAVTSSLTNVIYTSNVVAITGNTIQVNTLQHLITSVSNNKPYQVFPSYVNTTYQIITSAP